LDHILHSKLQLTKVCAKWVPHKLSAEHKEKRVETSKQLLEVLEKGYNNIITGDETWNKVWLERAANCQNCEKFEKKECSFSFILQRVL